MSTQIHGMTLRPWQSDAITKWEQCGRLGIVEAVTGPGKTAVGIAAAADAIGRGDKTIVVVPGVDLLEQWYGALGRALPTARIGRRGSGHQDQPADVDVLVAVVNSAISKGFHLPPGKLLLIADEVHRYGAESFSEVLSTRFTARLGLTATLVRSDDAVSTILVPYFGSVINGCDYTRAKEEDILAPIRVMTVRVPFTPTEYHEYQELEARLVRERFRLIEEFGCRDDPFGLFMTDVQDLSRSGDIRAAKAARSYLSAFSGRKKLLANGAQKLTVLGEIGSVLAEGGRTMVFSETKESCHAVALVLQGRGVEAKPFTSDLNRPERIQLLADFRDGRVSALAAPRVLDEGIDVAEADLGVIAASSKSRRQMIQRMGRVIRPKSDGRPATFVVLYMEGSIEDPARGAHEEFLGDLLDVADSVIDTSSEDAPATLAGWLGIAPEQVVENQQSPRVTALRRLSEGEDLTGTVRAGTAAELLVALAAGTDIHRLDRGLAVLSVLTAPQLSVVAERFGLGGDGVRRSVREAADSLDLDPHLVVRIEDEALARLEHPDTIPAVRDLMSHSEGVQR